ncbi:hypothetical protein [Klebsiella pneumoniae]|uniref:hypothetical protein n=1 Tax=Klebsiella pneumoniae TaxID=573 RepID=UPI0034D25011
MKKSILTIVLALASTSALADFPGEQVWNASISNNQVTCGIDYPNGSPIEGGILTAGESGTDTGKAITFLLRTNTANASWKLTEAKLVSNTGRFTFGDDLTAISSKTDTSVFINNAEYSWSEALQAHNLGTNAKTLKLAPKINMEQQYLPTGTTRIQGKIVVTCSN